MRDLIIELDQARRAVAAGELPGGTAHVVELRRELHAPVADVWDACTDPDRVARWFLPLSGELRLGGRFRLEGNAEGSILVCEPPRRLEVTWECGDLVPSRVTLDLTAVGDDSTAFVLRHTVADDEQWARFGPGAVGVGWDLPVTVLGMLVAGGEVPIADAFMSDPGTPELMRRSAAAWGAAHETAGAPAPSARRAAAETSAFYAPEPTAP